MTAPAAVKCGGVLSEAKIILHYNSGSWGKNDCTVTLIHEDGTKRVVLVATTEDRLKIPEVADGWFYGVYVPGKWECLLDGSKLEAIADKRKAFRYAMGRREGALMAKQNARQSASESFRQKALENYGIQ